MIFIKRTKLILDCFTSNPSAFEWAKPDHAVKFIPEWWKNLPKVDDRQFAAQANMKQCAGFVDYFRSGIALPMWSDLDVKTGPVGDDSYAWQYSDGESHATSHNPQESGSFLNPKEVLHLKLIYPWRFLCSEKINWVWTQFGWQKPINVTYQVLPGVLSFKYQTGANINIVFQKQKTESLTQFKFRTPIVYMSPLSDKKVVLKHHMVSAEEFSNMQKKVVRSSFVGAYNKIKKYMEADAKCPMK